MGRVMTPRQPAILSLPLIWGLLINLTVSKPGGEPFNPHPTRVQSNWVARDPKYPSGADFLAKSTCQCLRAACEAGCRWQTHPRAARPENPAARDAPAVVPALQHRCRRAACEEARESYCCLGAGVVAGGLQPSEIHRQSPQLG